jgi:regulator of RNase E activity RraA
VVLKGVAVMPGRYVFADSSGAVVVPDGQIEEVRAGGTQSPGRGRRLSRQITREQGRER